MLRQTQHLQWHFVFLDILSVHFAIPIEGTLRSLRKETIAHVCFYEMSSSHHHGPALVRWESMRAIAASRGTQVLW